MLDSMLQWLQGSALASAVGGSIALTSWLIALHVLAFSFVMGSALFANLRLVGALLPRAALRDVVIPANRAILGGLAVTVATGIPLFSAKATDAAANGWFQLKIALAIAAVAFQLMGPGRLALRSTPVGGGTWTTGAIGLALWSGLAAAACAFILLE